MDWKTWLNSQRDRPPSAPLLIFIHGSWAGAWIMQGPWCRRRKRSQDSRPRSSSLTRHPPVAMMPSGGDCHGQDWKKQAGRHVGLHCGLCPWPLRHHDAYFEQQEIDCIDLCDALGRDRPNHYSLVGFLLDPVAVCDQ